MLILTFIVLMLNPGLNLKSDSTGQRRVSGARIGYSQRAPRFAQFPVRTKQKGERNWLSLGRCDQASGKDFDRLVRDKAGTEKPIFAGHYSIVVCSCGTECGGVSIVNVKTGRLYFFGHLSQECSNAYSEGNDILRFRIDSSLLIMTGNAPNWKNGAERYKGCAIRYYRWTGRRLVLVKERPISKTAA
jgi:hypothetical protein